MLLSWYERLLKSMVTVHIPLLYCWSLPSRATLFFKLSMLFGSRSVSTLTTLLLLSYSKLLCTIIACLQLVITTSIMIQILMDLSMLYGQSKLLIWLVSTHLPPISSHSLFHFTVDALYTSPIHNAMVEECRSLAMGPLKFIAQYKPLYDAYFAPLTDKHHYWFR